MLDLRGKTVLVTGATGSLGSALVARLRAAGARTALVERSLERLRDAYAGSDAASRAGDQTHGSAGDTLLLAADLTDEPAVREAVATVVARFGAIDALVNAVGAYRSGLPVHEEPLATWDALERANVRTTLVACRAVLPGMLERGRGAIVNVASRDAHAARPLAAAYAAAKAAVVRLTEAIAAEGRGRGVRASCVLPGTLDTPAGRAATPRSRWPELVALDAAADAIVFLVSDASRAVSGAALPLGGPEPA